MNTRIKTCYISAAAGTPLGTLRAVLADRGVSVLVPEDMALGASWSSEISTMIAQADLVIGVLTQNRNSEWVLFELGLATGLRRQIILFAPPNVTSFPSLVNGLVLVRSELNNREAISFVLDQVLAAPAPPQHQYRSNPISQNTLGNEADYLLEKFHQVMASGRSRDLEGLIANALRHANVDVVAEAQVEDGRRVDLAIWSDDLQSSMGNPLLVEIKSSLRNPYEVRKAARQLTAATTSFAAGWGLLLYGGCSIGDDEVWSATPPNVLTMSIASLFEAMRTRPFPEIVKDLRNRRVHGIKP